MSTAAPRATAIVLQDGESTLATRTAGLLVASLFPALLWTFVIAQVAALLDAAIAWSHLGFVGIGIALFLAAVCAPIMFRR